MSAPLVVLYNETRKAQYTLSQSEKLDTMLNILKAKFRGFENILKYHERPTPHIPGAPQVAGELLLWEAHASREYWRALLSLLPHKILLELKEKYGFEGRRPRSRDPINQPTTLPSLNNEELKELC
ncbi:CRISPR-associated endonuclease Cas1 [Thermogladius sp.]|uniref:CRISPR-associated endonuclease Cas1 n=1 Tax=Thermogladius sp. TaxID=2023064 RepID=UPI003D141B75